MSIFDIRPERWTEQAACVGEDPEIFFPVGRSGRFGDPGRNDAGKAVCARCPVRERCLTEALEQEAGFESHRFGIRGGLDEFERGRLVRGGAA